MARYRRKFAAPTGAAAMQMAAEQEARRIAGDRDLTGEPKPPRQEDVQWLEAQRAAAATLDEMAAPGLAPPPEPEEETGTEKVTKGARKGAILGAIGGPKGMAAGAAIGAGAAWIASQAKPAPIGTLEGGRVTAEKDESMRLLQALLDVQTKIARVGTPIKDEIRTIAAGSRM